MVTFVIVYYPKIIFFINGFIIIFVTISVFVVLVYCIYLKYERLDYYLLSARFITVWLFAVILGTGVFGYIYVPTIITAYDVLKYRIKKKPLSFSCIIKKFIVIMVLYACLKYSLPIIFGAGFGYFESRYVKLYKSDLVSEKDMYFMLMQLLGMYPARMTWAQLYDEKDLLYLNRGYTQFKKLPLGEQIKMWNKVIYAIEKRGTIISSQLHPFGSQGEITWPRVFLHETGAETVTRPIHAFVPIVLHDLPGLKFLFGETGCNTDIVRSYRFLNGRNVFTMDERHAIFLSENIKTKFIQALKMKVEMFEHMYMRKTLGIVEMDGVFINEPSCGITGGGHVVTLMFDDVFEKYYTNSGPVMKEYIRLLNLKKGIVSGKHDLYVWSYINTLGRGNGDYDTVRNSHRIMIEKSPILNQIPFHIWANTLHVNENIGSN